jgi:hypothetical protein
MSENLKKRGIGGMKMCGIILIPKAFLFVEKD